MSELKASLLPTQKISPPKLIKSTDTLYIYRKGRSWFLFYIHPHIYTESFSLFSIIMVEFSYLFLIVRRRAILGEKPQCSKFISGVNPELNRLSQSFTPR